MVVSDWVWAAHQRAAGRGYVFVPCSRAVRGLVVAGDCDLQTQSDLACKSIGIAGGPVGKSWLILQGCATNTERTDLKTQTELVFGSPSLVFKKALQGDLKGAINFWLCMAKMEARAGGNSSRLKMMLKRWALIPQRRY